MATPGVQPIKHISYLTNINSNKEESIRDALQDFVKPDTNKTDFIKNLCSTEKLTKSACILANLIKIFLEKTNQTVPDNLRDMLKNTPPKITNAVDNCERVNIDQHFRISGSGFNLSGNTYIISGLLDFTYELIEKFHTNNPQQLLQNPVTIESDDEDETKDSDKIMHHNNSPRISTIRLVNIVGIQKQRVIFGINYLAESGNPKKQKKWKNCLK